ncbi:MAG: Lar family restriction alleviation protein [Bacilli bacterium]
MNDDLKPCPFCGYEAFVWPARIIPGFRVSCTDGCASMPARPDMTFATRKQAAEAWNRRSEEKEAIPT